jgi:pectinesterase
MRPVRPYLCLLTALATLLAACASAPVNAADAIPPDFVVAADGSGDFTTIAGAMAMIPPDNRERIVVLVRDGVYNEKFRIDASRVTLRGESREGTRIEYLQGNEAFGANPDAIGRAIINIEGEDVIIENLTAENLFPEIGPHAFTVYGRGTRAIIQNADCLSTGADTVSIWPQGGGMSYYANCNFKGSVDFVCPRGWCYMRDCRLYEVKRTAAIWIDGGGDPTKKFVVRDCVFDGTPGFKLGRQHVDGQFYLLGCTFTENMADEPIYHVTYPDNPSRDRPLVYGKRHYFLNCRREGGDDFAWYADNLSSAEGSPTSEQITPLWTYEGQWDPERTDPPAIESVAREGESVVVTFGEDVTVRGKPRLALAGGGFADYAVGSGTSRLTFTGSSGAPERLDLNGGTIVACLATAKPRLVVGQPLGDH